MPGRVGRSIRWSGYFRSGATSLPATAAVSDFNAAPAILAGTGTTRYTATAAFAAAPARFAGFQRLTSTGAFAAAPARFASVGNIGVAPHLTIDTQGPRATQFPLPRTVWTVDGIPVSMYEASWSTAWDGGYDQMRGRLTEADMVRAGLVQGTLVRGYTADGAIVFEGRISTPPEVSDGMATIGAQGIRVKAEHKVERLFIQSRSMDIWAATNAEPHLDGTGGSVYGDNSKIAVDQQGGIVWRLDRNVDISNDKENGLICYLEGVEIKRVAYHGHWDANDDENDLSIRLYRANGPTGSTVLINDVPCTPGNRNEAKDQTFAVTDDAALLMLHTHAAFTPGDVLRYQAQRIRVNSEVCTDDEFTGSQIVDYIGTTIGWDTTRVDATTENALPFDWDEGSWADALTYVAETDDRYWRVVAGDQLEYADWGTKTWTAYLSRGTNADLTPEEVFNEVWVWFDTPNGVRRRVRITPDDIGLDDPLDARNIYEYEMNDRQHNADQATRVATRLLRRVIVPRHSGTLTCTMLFNDSGASRPYEAMAGDEVRIADWGPNASLTLRILATEGDANGVRLGVERHLSLGGLLRHRRGGGRRRSGWGAQWHP